MNLREVCRIFITRDKGHFPVASDAAIDLAIAGLSVEEIAELASAIANSGDIISLPAELSPYADVPSTGGPASLTTLFCPLLLAAFGCRVPKISARGSVAGAIDTLHLISGFQTSLDARAFSQALKVSNIAHIEQTDRFCPADQVLIATRRRRNLMKQPALAAASLIAKKLVVPGTIAVFDFRIGPGGNISDDVTGAHYATGLFAEVAEKLGLTIGIACSDGSLFPSSALGRLESLSLLFEFVQGGEPENALDLAHRNACIEIAVMAIGLVYPAQKPDDVFQRLLEILAAGNLVKVLEKHLEAQGASLAALQNVLEQRSRQNVITLEAPEMGYWSPPDVCEATAWIKNAQREIESNIRYEVSSSVAKQVGLRLLVSPGQWVMKKQPVVELHHAPRAKLDKAYQALTGSISGTPPAARAQIIERIWPGDARAVTLSPPV